MGSGGVRGAPRPAPSPRVRAANDAAVRAGGDFVLYWMFAAHRVRFNFALDHAIARAAALGKALVVLELIRCRYRWASDRVHRFLLEGLDDNAKALGRAGVLHYPFVEESPGEGDGLVRALASRACLVVADDFPAFFFPDWIEGEARACPVLVEQVDGNGLLPMRVAASAYPTAHAFRRFLQKSLRPHLEEFPEADPLDGLDLPRPAALPDAIVRRWPPAPESRLRGDVSGLPLDHAVRPVSLRGGQAAASAAAARFVRERLARYAEDRNEPGREGTSGLSPYLHFGHLSVHEVLAAVALQEGWSPSDVSSRADGSRSGWWGMGASAEAFLDELVTWRELGFNFCAIRSDYDRYDSLPPWARDTLERHAGDPRPRLYSLGELEAGRTHDPLWNAAQRQLVAEGRIHNYVRMLWGKKILEWSASPVEALRAMVELNNRYALDGRDPNSYSGIFWVLGRYDRPWGPERPIFGTVRYMSSDSVARKVRVKDYVSRFAGEGGNPVG